MWNPLFNPVLVPVKEEPFSRGFDTDEKPCMDDLVNSISVPNGENSQLPPGPTTGMAEMDDTEYWTISGKKPYFNVIIAQSHVSPNYQMYLPKKILPELHSAFIPVVLTSGGKSWTTFYHGDRTGKRFGPSWKEFAIDNDLKIGDCCFFELMESSPAKIKFKVIILRGDLPTDEGEGDTPETPIIIE